MLLKSRYWVLLWKLWLGSSNKGLLNPGAISDVHFVKHDQAKCLWFVCCFLYLLNFNTFFLRASLVTQLVMNPAMQETWLGSIPGLGRSPREENCYPLQYSGLENSMDCIVHGVAKRVESATLDWATFSFHFTFFLKDSWENVLMSNHYFVKITFPWKYGMN